METTMSRKPYGMICPITRACEILEPRWTIPILCGLWAGCTKFNDLRREVGSISPALLSKRLKELEAMGFIERVADPASGSVDYVRTEAAIALEPALEALARWAQCHIEAEAAMCTATVSNLMWKIRDYFRRDELPRRRVVLQFRFADPELDYQIYWAILAPGMPAEVCTSIPGFDIDLFVETEKASLLGVLLGRTTLGREIDAGRLYLSGDAVLSRTIHRWLKVRDGAPFDGIRMLPDDLPAPQLAPRHLAAPERPILA